MALHEDLLPKKRISRYSLRSKQQSYNEHDKVLAQISPWHEEEQSPLNMTRSIKRSPEYY